MQVNGQFVDHLKQAGLTPEHHLYFICRSGGRSTAAARGRAAGRIPARHTTSPKGSRGRRTRDGHRGTVTGWKADGLPWRQK